MRRNVGLVFVCGLVLPLAVAGSAMAQGSTLQVSNATPAPGQTITVSGRGYSQPAGTSAIALRLGTRNAPAFTTVSPDSLNRISESFPAPSTPGWHLILATQTTTNNGRQRSFTPGRVRIRVTGGSAGAASPTGGGRGGLPDSPPVLVALGAALLLLAAGATLTARRIRTLNRPHLDGQAR